MSSVGDKLSEPNPDLVWNGVEVEREICPPPSDRIKYPAEAKHCLTLHLANSDRAEQILNNGKRLLN